MQLLPPRSTWLKEGVNLLTSASARAEKGVSGAGLMTAVQPATSAAPTFQVIIADGKFHGVEIKARPIRRRDNTYTTPIKQVVSTDQDKHDLHSPTGCDHDVPYIGK
jgi:hypothetical protein